MTLPRAPTELPLFPLPNVVHFPHTELRLHIFEPRYRHLVRDRVLDLLRPFRHLAGAAAHN